MGGTMLVPLAYTARVESFGRGGCFAAVSEIKASAR